MPGPIIVVRGHAIAAPGANTDIFTARSPIKAHGQIRVLVSLATSSIFDIRWTDGTTAYSSHLNGGVALPASCLMAFDVPFSKQATSGANSTATAPATMTYSFRVATDSVIEHLEVWELDEPVA